jgi:hypothetical protein
MGDSTASRMHDTTPGPAATPPASPAAAATHSSTAAPAVDTDAAARRPQQWLIDINVRDQKFVDVVISLSTGSLVLPPLLLRTYLGVTDSPLAMFLDWPVYWSWGLLTAAILSGIAFHYASSKWVKHAWGLPLLIQPRKLEVVMNILFWVMILSFVSGLVFFLIFVRRA